MAEGCGGGGGGKPRAKLSFLTSKRFDLPVLIPFLGIVEGESVDERDLDRSIGPSLIDSDTNCFDDARFNWLVIIFAVVVVIVVPVDGVCKSLPLIFIEELDIGDNEETAEVDEVNGE